MGDSFWGLCRFVLPTLLSRIGVRNSLRQIQMSNEKRDPGFLMVFLGDEKLPSYMRVIVKALQRNSVKQPVQWKVYGK